MKPGQESFESIETGVSHRILVLNRIWQPVNIVGVKRAFSLLFQDHARVVHPMCGSFQVFDRLEWLQYSVTEPPPAREAVQTIRLAIRLPQILLLNHFDRLPVQEVKFSRATVFERDDFTCQYCGENFRQGELNLDHVIPRHRGGQTSWENIVTSCVSCNTRKANRLPHEAGMRLIRRPSKPRWRPFVSFPKGSGIRESWETFLHVSSKSSS